MTILVVSIFCYIGVKVPPELFWPASVLGYIIPLVIALNLLFLALYALLKKKLFWYHIIALIFLSPFILMSYRIGNTSQPEVEESFKVLSLNAKLFRKPGSYEEFSSEMINWFMDESSDIKCIQEFSYNPGYQRISIISKMQEKGYHHFNYELNLINRPGLAIFSRHPILYAGVIDDHDSTNVNKCIYADININADTVRIYNVHLRSMRIDLSDYSEMRSLGRKAFLLTKKLGRGARKRSKQIDDLITHASTSPYPVIICGDFNEIPYSYNYFEMRSFYQNAFEEKGEGFGFTFNSDILPIRIDHQFYGHGINLMSFHTNRNITWSDHFPLQGVYSLEGSLHL